MPNTTQNQLKHWPTWSSPVGLGLFMVAVCFSVWLLSQAFGWG